MLSGTRHSGATDLVIINGEDLDALWAHVFPREEESPHQLNLVSYSRAPMVMSLMRPQPQVILLCIDHFGEGFLKDIGEIRESLENPLTPIIGISKNVDPDIEAMCLRDAGLFDFLTFPPVDSLLRQRIVEARVFAAKTFPLRLDLKLRGYTSGLSNPRLRAEIAAAEHRVVVVGGEDPVLSGVLSSISGVSYEFVRRESEVLEALKDRPRLVVVGSDVISTSSPQLTRWSSSCCVPLLGLSPTSRMDFLVARRHDGFMDVIAQPVHPTILRERVRALLSHSYFLQPSCDAAAGAGKFEVKRRLAR